MRRALFFVVLLGCAREASAPNASMTRGAAAAPSASIVRWAEVTRSPWPASTREGRDTRLAAFCGERDEALEGVAARLLSEQVRDADRALALLRAGGEPHVRPRVVIATGQAPIGEEVLRAQLESVKSEHSRCGIAIGLQPNSEEIVLTVAIDALADLAPLPTRARTGEWLSLDASLTVPAEGAKVVLMGPRGLPRTIPTSFDAEAGRVRARFVLDQPGAFTVQVVVDLVHGPQPVLEARVFADVVPTIEDEVAPGEEAARGTEGTAAMTRMLNAARASERLPPLSSDPKLDAVARAHAERMRDTKRTAHDLGDGDLRSRMTAANVEATSIGENVARASSIVAAHRALHASPSHRMNMLGHYTRVGVGIATSTDGSVYVCQVFAR
jgi:uncharacterized protein YkwD